MSIIRTFRCEGCGDVFEYEKRKPTYCEECRRIKLNASTQRYKKRRRKIEQPAKGDKEENLAGRSGLIAAIGGAQYKEIGQLLNIDFREVHKLERQALTKIRNNPELKELWDTLKSELAGGAAEGGVLSLGISPAKKGELLLDYQQSVADWWQTYAEVEEWGCTDEAIELMTEIAKIQKTIERTLLTL